MTKMSKDVLSTAIQKLLGGTLADMPLDRLHLLITLTQHATDLLLNEIERRGDLTFHHGLQVMPYMSDDSVPTILTREEGE